MLNTMSITIFCYRKLFDISAQEFLGPNIVLEYTFASLLVRIAEFWPNCRLFLDKKEIKTYFRFGLYRVPQIVYIFDIICLLYNMQTNNKLYLFAQNWISAKNWGSSKRQLLYSKKNNEGKNILNLKNRTQVELGRTLIFHRD